ncbi:MAG: hypothetical protein MUF52_03205 [Syntrophobacteraceae bacterium]|nr:hypothetical protein [Syntrophobacteraceae bacterium]
MAIPSTPPGGRATLSRAFMRHYAQSRPTRSRRPRAAFAALLCLTGALWGPVEANLSVGTCALPVQPNGHRVTVTAYTNIPSCTDSTPDETASMLRIRPGHHGRIIALSRDLARGYRFGDRFHLIVGGKTHVVEFQDLMARRHTNRIDLLLPSKRKCQEFGVSSGVLLPIGRASRAGPGDRRGRS